MNGYSEWLPLQNDGGDNDYDYEHGSNDKVFHAPILLFLWKIQSVEILLAHAEVSNCFDESDQRWNIRPEENQIEKSLSDFPEHKLMDSDSSSEESNYAD